MTSVLINRKNTGFSQISKMRLVLILLTIAFIAIVMAAGEESNGKAELKVPYNNGHLLRRIRVSERLQLTEKY